MEFESTAASGYTTEYTTKYRKGRSEEIPKDYKFAGVVPYAYNNATLYFLIARERKSEDLRGGEWVEWGRSRAWTFFSGSIEPTDDVNKGFVDTIQNAAAREGYEESMGFLGTFDEIKSKIIKSEKNNMYYEGGLSSKGRLYVIPINYNPQFPKLYKRLYDFLTPCLREDQKTIRVHKRNVTTRELLIKDCPKGYLEKSELEWVSHDELLGIINKNNWGKAEEIYLQDKAHFPIL